VGREARAFFGVGPDLAIEAIATVADRFPVFRVVPDPADVLIDVSRLPRPAQPTW
jgi:hypothetical protein